MTDQLKKDSFHWNQEAKNVFEMLKKAMKEAPVLALPYFTKTFTIETDACKEGIGAVLLQEKRPLAFMSKK